MINIAKCRKLITIGDQQWKWSKDPNRIIEAWPYCSGNVICAKARLIAEGYREATLIDWVLDWESPMSLDSPRFLIFSAQVSFLMFSIGILWKKSDKPWLCRCAVPVLVWSILIRFRQVRHMYPHLRLDSFLDRPLLWRSHSPTGWFQRKRRKKRTGRWNLERNWFQSLLKDDFDIFWLIIDWLWLLIS